MEGVDSGTGCVEPEQTPVSREELGAAEGIKRRSQAALSAELETSSAAVPLVPMDPGAGPHEALLWATQIATEAEEIMNATLLTSVNVVLPRDMGMMPSRRAKNGWYPGIEADRKLVSQLDKMDFKMSRGGGWAIGLDYRSRLVRLGIYMERHRADAVCELGGASPGSLAGFSQGGAEEG